MQMRFELGDLWGTKDAGGGRPPSKDSIAYNDPNGLVNWDWQNGTTRKPIVVFGQSGEPIPGQHFIAVAPVNHLSSTPSNGGTDNTGDSKDTITLVKEVLVQLKIVQADQVELLKGQVLMMESLNLLLDKQPV